MNTASASPRDQFLFMLLDRVTALEAALSEYDVDVVAGRVVLPAGKGSFAERVAVAVQVVGEAAHAALPGLVAEVELSCTADEMRTQDMYGGLLRMINPRMLDGDFPFERLLKDAGGLMEAPEVTMTVSLRGKRPLPTLERALSSEFGKRGIQLVGCERVSPGRVAHTRWVYSADGHPTVVTSKPVTLGGPVRGLAGGGLDMRW